MGYRKRTLLPIGIHMNAGAVYMVQLEQTESTVEAVAKASKQFALALVGVAVVAADGPDEGTLPPSASSEFSPEPYEEACRFVRETIESSAFRGKNVVISLPPEHLVIQHVRLAPVPPDELMAALLGELQGKLPFEPRDAVLGHIIAGTVTESNETKQDVIVLAARRDVVERYVSTVHRMGLSVVGVGLEPCAMCYPYLFAATRAAATPSGPPVSMIIYLGVRVTHVAIVRGPDTTFVKGVEVGTDHLAEAIAADRHTSVHEAIALQAAWREATGDEGSGEAVAAYNRIKSSLEHVVDEIKSCMRYHASLARGAHIDRFLFVGPAARDRALVRVIGAHLGVACEVGNPLGAILESGDLAAAEPELTVATGLSLFEAQ